MSSSNNLRELRVSWTDLVLSFQLTGAESLKSSPIFEHMNEYLKTNGAEIVKKCNAIYNFEITEKKKGPVTVTWTIDLKNGTGSIKQGKAANADASFTMADEDYILVTLRKLNPQMAFLNGSMKIKGNMKKATVFTPELFPQPTAEQMAEFAKQKL